MEGVSAFVGQGGHESSQNTKHHYAGVVKSIKKKKCKVKRKK